MRKRRILVIGDSDTIHTQRLINRLASHPDLEVGHFWFGERLPPLAPGVRLFGVRPPRRPAWPAFRRAHRRAFLGLALFRFHPDVVHVLSQFGFCLSVRRLNARVPLVFTLWGHLGGVSPEFTASLRTLAAVTADSEPLLQELDAAAGTPFRERVLMRFGADLDRFKPGPPEPEIDRLVGLEPGDVLIYSGRSLRPPYNHDVGVEAFAAISGRHPRARLLLKNHHGWRYPDSDSCRRDLQERAARRGIADRLRWLEHLDYALLPQLYRRARITLSIPSEDGFPATIPEAMACGSLLVVGDLPDYRGFIENGVNALTIPPRSPEALAAALERLLADGREPETLRRNALATVREKGDFAREVEKLAELYRRLS